MILALACASPDRRVFRRTTSPSSSRAVLRCSARSHPEALRGAKSSSHCDLVGRSSEQLRIAAGVGFEPTDELPRQRFSRPPDSTALAPRRATSLCRRVGVAARRGLRRTLFGCSPYEVCRCDLALVRLRAAADSFRMAPSSIRGRRVSSPPDAVVANGDERNRRAGVDQSTAPRPLPKQVPPAPTVAPGTAGSGSAAIWDRPNIPRTNIRPPAVSRSGKR